MAEAPPGLRLQSRGSSPEGHAQADAWLPKSRLCRHWANNRCTQGSDCTFAHSLYGLTLIPEEARRHIRKCNRGEFNAWDGDLSMRSKPIIPSSAENLTTMTWAVQANIPAWVPELFLEATIQHGAAFLRQSMEQSRMELKDMQSQSSRSPGLTESLRSHVLWGLVVNKNFNIYCQHSTLVIKRSLYLLNL